MRGPKIGIADASKRIFEAKSWWRLATMAGCPGRCRRVGGFGFGSAFPVG